jgi:hypothetical protein
MTVFTAHYRRSAADQPDVVLVKEGFCWPAFLVPPLWLLARRLWLGLLIYALGAAAVAGAAEVAGLSEVAAGAASVAFGLWIAWTANDWRREKLDRLGYRELGVIVAESLDEAEERLFRARATSLRAP